MNIKPLMYVIHTWSELFNVFEKKATKVKMDCY